MSHRPDRTSSDSDNRYENSGRSRGNYGRDRHPRPGGDGNIAKLEANSGSVVIIDQFMLGSAQFLKRIGYFLTGESSPVDERSFIEALKPAAAAFGGTVLEIEPGNYGVYRDPSTALMAIAPESRFAVETPELSEDGEDENFGNRIDDEEVGPAAVVRRLVGERADKTAISRVCVETRCLAFIDSKHLRDPDMVHRYKELRDQRDDKAARDLLRKYGAAVRYGFNRRGDQLGLFKLDGDNSFGLWAN